MPCASAQSPRLAVLCDYLEEDWPSMDLCGEMLLDNMSAEAVGIEADQIRPHFQRVVQRVPVAGRSKVARNTDRLLNRLVSYPSYARRIAPAYDVFHIVDHSYAFLVDSLPNSRTGVYCHDLDAIRCLLEPQTERRPFWFRRLARRILHGLQNAAIVFHNSRQTGDQLVAAGIVDPYKLVHSPLGTASEFTLTPRQAEPHLPWLEQIEQHPWLLHVGSCIARKRIDVLLDVLAAVRESIPDIKLIKVGGAWSQSQRQQIEGHALQESITHVSDLSRDELAVLYRRANAVLVPSEAEGFGLPVIEALACGATVVTSDIPVLREVGSSASIYCPVNDVQAWAATVANVLSNSRLAPTLEARLARARQFSWRAHANTISRAYHRILC